MTPESQIDWKIGDKAYITKGGGCLSEGDTARISERASTEQWQRVLAEANALRAQIVAMTPVVSAAVYACDSWNPDTDNDDLDATTNLIDAVDQYRGANHD